MNRRRRAIIFLILILAISNYTRIQSMGNIRAVEFLSIFSIGLLTGILLTDLLRNRRE